MWTIHLVRPVIRVEVTIHCVGTKNWVRRNFKEKLNQKSSFRLKCGQAHLCTVPDKIDVTPQIAALRFSCVTLHVSLLNFGQIIVGTSRENIWLIMQLL
jgi:hypothetical protein